MNKKYYCLKGGWEVTETLPMLPQPAFEAFCFMYKIDKQNYVVFTNGYEFRLSLLKDDLYFVEHLYYKKWMQRSILKRLIDEAANKLNAPEIIERFNKLP